MLIWASFLWFHCSSVSGNDKTPFFWSLLSCCSIPYGERRTSGIFIFSGSKNSLESWETRSVWNKCCFSSPLSVSKMEMFGGNQSCFSNYCENAVHRPTILLQVFDNATMLALQKFTHTIVTNVCRSWRKVPQTTADCTLVETKRFISHFVDILAWLCISLEKRKMGLKMAVEIKRGSD